MKIERSVSLSASLGITSKHDFELNLLKHKRIGVIDKLFSSLNISIAWPQGFYRVFQLLKNWKRRRYEEGCRSGMKL